MAGQAQASVLSSPDEPVEPLETGVRRAANRRSHGALCKGFTGPHDIFAAIGERRTGGHPAPASPPPTTVTVPFGFTTFPGEIWRTPRSWVEVVYPNVIYFNEVEKGGHFAAWEEPELFSEELRAAFRSLR
jgi:hypothetical protein